MNTKQKYTIHCQEVFHLYEPEYKCTLGEYDSYDEAVAVCKEELDEFIEDYGSDRKNLALAYAHHGENLHVSPTPEGVEPFSSIHYYEEAVERHFKNKSEQADVLLEKAKILVEERILGERKGLPGEANFKHSLRVHEIVSRLHHWDDPDMEMFIAALLHDIVEDGDTSFEELVEMGFSRKTVELVHLCTHDAEIENPTERWTLMIAKLIEARSEEAWCIKLIDLADNLTQSSGLSPENRKFMLEVKAPLILRLTEWLGNGHANKYRHYLETTLQEVCVTG